MNAIPERTGVTTFRNRQVTLLGTALAVGDPAPAFTVIGPDMAPVASSAFDGGVRLISSVPSLETPVCDLQARKYAEAAADLGEVAVLTVSVDLPFAQARWCGAAGIAGARVFSDHRDVAFGLAHGTLIKEFRLLARAVFVVGADDRLVHVEYVPAIEQEPDYEAALSAARSAEAARVAQAS
jgi:thiol peroxidase